MMKRTILERKHLKQNYSEKNQPGKGRAGNEHMKKGTVLNMTNLKKQFRTGQHLKTNNIEEDISE